MAHQTNNQDRGEFDRRAGALRFTPAEWRRLLEDRAFLNECGNRYTPPRRLMGVDVEIVPDHRFG